MSKTNERYIDIMEEIQTVLKELNTSMNTKDNWEIPGYSGAAISKAGKTIINKNSSLPEIDEAMKILNNWRSAHAYPLQVISDELRLQNPTSNVVQRLKRLDSITGKMKRFPKMDLYRMQDLGGCRIIVDTLEDVYAAMNRYKQQNTKHEFRRENDYIQNPKESGYRSYHVVYKFHDDINTDYNKNIQIEIQFRTKLQHVWATAVEMMGVYTKSQLKASIGDKDILRFFVLVSSIFALKENTPVCPNTSGKYDLLVKEIKEIDSRLNIISMLSAMSVAIEHTGKKLTGYSYYLLQLNYKKKVVNVHGFTMDQIGIATKCYDKVEAKNSPDIDAVLVSGESFDSLREAYPNYFADIEQFVNMMRKIIE